MSPPDTPAATASNSDMDNTSPPTKRVRINEGENAGHAADTSIPSSQKSMPAFLTPPTSGTIPDDNNSSSDAFLTHDNLCGAATGSPNATAAATGKGYHSNKQSDIFYTPRGGEIKSCDSGRSPAGPMTHSEIRTLLKNEAGYDVDDPRNVKKREGYLTWDDYFMAVASLSSQRSKDPHSQVGACIVDEDNRIVGIGYNGFPRGCSDDCLPWAANRTEASSRMKQNAGNSSGDNNKDGIGNEEKKANDDDDDASPPLSVLHTRDPFMCHAEVNAILNKCSSDVAGSRMYVARFPCNECAKVIIQSRIREVVYLADDAPCKDLDTYRAARIMFEMAGVKTRQYKATRTSVTLDFGPLDTTSIIAKEEGDETCKVSDGIAKGDSNAAASSDQTKYRDLLLKEANYDPMKPAVPKRTGYLSWDAYFMAVSFLSAQRSKDPNTQVGACIVDANKCIVGIGYNGFPRGCSDECLPWSRRAESELHKKYCYVAHAEVNSILNKCSADVRGATIYVALFPCNDCAKVIIQSGIREVVYLNDQYHDTDGCRASRIMFEMAGVRTRQYRPESRTITVDMM